jgi:predicted heme/steroid binding protein
MTIEELAQYTGKNGQPAYVAVGGAIYDVSKSPLWKDGLHTNAHQAGADLTEELKTAPHIGAIIERFPCVGHLEAQPLKGPTGNKKIFISAALVIVMIIAWFFSR